MHLICKLAYLKIFSTPLIIDSDKVKKIRNILNLFIYKIDCTKKLFHAAVSHNIAEHSCALPKINLHVMP